MARRLVDTGVGAGREAPAGAFSSGTVMLPRMARWMITLITGWATRRAPDATFRTCSFCAALATKA